MSEPCTGRAYLLIADFALGIDGAPQGLTPAELRRAWQARHGGQLSRRTYGRLSEDLLVQVLPRRPCEVTGRRMHPYVPSIMGCAPW